MYHSDTRTIGERDRAYRLRWPELGANPAT